MYGKRPITLPQSAGEFSKLLPQGYAADVHEISPTEIEAAINGDLWRETWNNRYGYWDDIEMRGAWRRRNRAKYETQVWQEKKEQRARLMSGLAMVRYDERRMSFSHWKKWQAQERAKAVAARADHRHGRSGQL